MTTTHRIIVEAGRRRARQLITNAGPEGLSGDDLAEFEQIERRARAHTEAEERGNQLADAYANFAGALAHGTGHGATTGTTTVRATALQSIERAATSDHARQAATVAIEAGNPEAEAWAPIAANPAYLRAYTSLLTDPERGHLSWDAEEREAFTAAQQHVRAMSIGTPGSGGYLVPFQLDPAFIITNDGAVNQIREAARVETTFSSAWNGITTAGVTAEWKAEGAEVADATPTLARPGIPVHLADAYVPFSFELEQDAPDLVAQLGAAMADAKMVLEAKAFTTGTGTGQPTGIITALAAASPSVLVAPTTPETFAIEDIYKLAAALPARHQAGASWLANPTTEYLVRQFATGTGPSHAFWADLGAGTPPTLVGKPWRGASDMDGTIDPAVTAAHNYLLAFGDFSRYVIADRIGTTTEIIPHVMGANGRPTGQRGLIMYWRVGADAVDANAFRLLDVPTTA